VLNFIRLNFEKTTGYSNGLSQNEQAWSDLKVILTQVCNKDVVSTCISFLRKNVQIIALSSLVNRIDGSKHLPDIDGSIFREFEFVSELLIHALFDLYVSKNVGGVVVELIPLKVLDVAYLDSHLVAIIFNDVFYKA
jgi:hypothetical protein